MIRRPSAILALLTLLNAVNYLDRNVLSAVLTRIETDLDLTHSRAGFLATVFLVGYFVTCPVFSALERRFPRTWLMTAGIVIWSGATIATGLSRDFWTLAAARAVVGVGEASFVTLAPTIIDDIAPRTRRGLWLSMFYIAMPVGAALGYIIGGAVEHAFGWRSAFFVAGGPGFLLALVLLLVREPERTFATDRPQIIGQFTQVLKIRGFRNAMFGYCANTFAIGAFSFWAPRYVEGQFHLRLDVANYKFGLITVATGILATLAGGVWSDRSTKVAPTTSGNATRGDESRGAAATDRKVVTNNLRICFISSIVGAPLAALCFMVGSEGKFFIAVAACEFAVFLLNSPIMVAIMRSVPSELRASASAITIFGIHLLGDLWSPWIVGTLADHIAINLAMMLLPVAIAAGALIWGGESFRRQALPPEEAAL